MQKISVQSDFSTLDDLLVTHLDINLWTGRRKLAPEDLAGVNLPPEELASLGSKKIVDPESLRVFGMLKARAFALMDRHGVRFLGGWGIPKDKAGVIVNELVAMRDEFDAAKDAFLASYDANIESWIEKHGSWADIIRNSIVGADHVRGRLGFRWQVFQVAPLDEHEDRAAVLEGGLADSVTGLGSTLFDEIAAAAREMKTRVFAERDSVTHKALRPLRALRDKLHGLSFVTAHVAPVVSIIDATLLRMPARGNLSGEDLLLLNGLVAVLEDTDSLLDHAQCLLNGNGMDSVLNGLIVPSRPAENEEDAENIPVAQEVPLTKGVPDCDQTTQQYTPHMPVHQTAAIDSMGLW